MLFLLAYAADPAAWHHHDETALTEAESLTDGVVMLYAALCDRALRQGVLRGYRDRDERLHTIRGRIDFTEQLRVSPGRELPLSVSYQEHDQDITENRLLLAALAAVSALPAHTEHVRRTQVRLRMALADVTPIRYDPRQLPTVTWTRLNAQYRPAVHLAHLILAGAETDLDIGTIRTPALVINMATVFERFVRTATRHTLGLTEQDFPAGAHAPPLWLDDAHRVPVEPDLNWWIDGRCRYVGELKYRYDSGKGTGPNLYQTLAYAIAAGVPHATLVYADGPDNTTSHYLPNARIRIHLRHLDLRAKPAALIHQIQSLADHISELTTPSLHRETATGNK